MRIAEKYREESLTPTAGDDASILGIVTQYSESTEQAIQSQIASFARHAEEDCEKSWSKLRQTAKRLRIELSITIQLNGELTRLEAADSGYEPLDHTQAAKPTRLGKLLGFAQRAQNLWPGCSTLLAVSLENEYLSVKNELAEEDREAEIESYLEDRRGSQY